MAEEVKLTIGDLKKKLSYLTDIVEGGGVFTDDTPIKFMADPDAPSIILNQYNSLEISADEAINEVFLIFCNNPDATQIGLGWSLKRFNEPGYIESVLKERDERNAKLA